MTPLERRGLLIQLRPHFLRRARVEERLEREVGGTRREREVKVDMRRSENWTPEMREAASERAKAAWERRRAAAPRRPRLVDRIHKQHIRELEC